jgi:uncharacterized protein (DUF983 family)
MAERLPSPFDAGFRCVCPRCGEGPLFTGYLTLRKRCESCGLEFGFAEGSEGPAVFIILIVGVVIVGAAALTEVAFHPHPMLHLAMWIPANLILSLLLLRPFKGIMIALHYRHIVHDGSAG